MAKKATPEELKAAVELQLSERRFILESLQTGAQLLQVPLVTAAVWFYLSRTNAAMGALNKAILAAELAPIVGDIQFPPGVLLGAAWESSEDFLKILDKAQVLDAEKVKEAAEEAVEDTGDVLADVLVGVTGLGKGKTCAEIEAAVFAAREAAEADKIKLAKNPLDLVLRGKMVGDTISYGLLLKSLKSNKCERPSYISEEKWRSL